MPTFLRHDYDLRSTGKTNMIAKTARGVREKYIVLRSETMVFLLANLRGDLHQTVTKLYTCTICMDM